MTMISKALTIIGLRPASADQPLTANWKILRAVVIIAACTVIAKLTATGKEIAVAGWFGRSDELDAFLIAMVLPTTILGLAASSFSGALSPSYIRIRETQGEAAAQRLFASVQVTSLGLLIAISIILAVGAPYYLPLLGSGFSPSKLLLTRRLLYLVLPVVVLTGTFSAWSSILNAREKFTLPALTPSVTPLVTVTALFVLGRAWGVFTLAAGVVVGAFFELAILAQGMRASGIPLRPRWYGMTPELRLVMGQYAPMAASALLNCISPIVDQSMAATLSGGSVAALNYGNKIINVITSLSSAALYTAVLPYFSQMVSKKDWRGCRRTLKVYSVLVLGVTIPLTVGLMAGSHPLVRLLYQRGAFTAADTRVVSLVQVLFSLMIPFYTWAVLFVRLLSALHRNQVLAYGSVMNVGLNILLNLVLMRLLGVAGIALSTSVVYAVYCLFMALFALKWLRRQEADESLT